jgi:hypothetical protein
MISDRLLSHKETVALRHSYPSLEKFSVPKTEIFFSLDDCIEKTKGLPYTEEGWVLRFERGQLVKVKSPAYLTMHRIVWMYTDNFVIEVMEAGDDKKLLDFLVTVPEEYSKTIQDTVAQLKRAKRSVIDKAYEIFSRAPKSSRKELALWIKNNVEYPYGPFVFWLYDSKPIPDTKIYKLFRDGTLPWKEEIICPN